MEHPEQMGYLHHRMMHCKEDSARLARAHELAASSQQGVTADGPAHRILPLQVCCPSLFNFYHSLRQIFCLCIYLVGIPPPLSETLNRIYDDLIRQFQSFRALRMGLMVVGYQTWTLPCVRLISAEDMPADSILKRCKSE